MDEDDKAARLFSQLLKKTKGPSLLINIPSENSCDKKFEILEQAIKEFGKVQAAYQNLGQSESESGSTIFNTNKSSTRKKNQQKKKRLEQLKETLLCIVCKDSKREILFTPCNHICCCEECGQKIINHCVYCKAVIQSKIKVYFP
jgi:4-diphosphocytidyl-2C-methyl-D-erythritol kinase